MSRPTPQTPAPLQPQGISIEVPNTLIVQFKASVSPTKRDEHIQTVRLKCREPTGTTRRYAGIEHVYSKCFSGYSGEFPPNVETFIRSQNSLFDVIERSVTMRFAAVTYTKADKPKNWGLAKISLTPEEFANPATGTQYSSASLGKGSNIYILDDGYTPATPETDQLGERLKNRDAARKSENGHGTMVADLAAGKDLGAAPEANVYVYTVCRGFYDKPETLEGYKALPTADAALIAFETIYFQNPIVVDPCIINCSFEVEMSKAEILKKTIKSACNDGFIIVVAAGNDGVEVVGEQAGVSGNIGPAGFPGVITVGAIGRDDTPMHIQNGPKLYASNYGELVDVYAPGVNLPKNGTTDTESGTSFAAPIVSGMIACMMATYKDSVSTSGEILSYHDVKSNILRWARTSTQKYDKGYYKIAFNQGPYQDKIKKVN